MSTSNPLPLRPPQPRFPPETACPEAKAGGGGSPPTPSVRGGETEARRDEGASSRRTCRRRTCRRQVPVPPPALTVTPRGDHRTSGTRSQTAPAKPKRGQEAEPRAAGRPHRFLLFFSVCFGHGPCTAPTFQGPVRDPPGTRTNAPQVPAPCAPGRVVAWLRHPPATAGVSPRKLGSWGAGRAAERLHGDGEPDPAPRCTLFRRSHLEKESVAPHTSRGRRPHGRLPGTV